MEFGVVRLGQVGVICFCSKALQGVHSFLLQLDCRLSKGDSGLY